MKPGGLIFSLFMVAVLFAGQMGAAKALHGDDRNLGNYACSLIVNNEYRKFFKLVDEGKVKIPDADVYNGTRCGAGDHILVEGVEPGSIDFMKKFLKAVRDKYGMD